MDYWIGYRYWPIFVFKKSVIGILAKFIIGATLVNTHLIPHLFSLPTYPLPLPNKHNKLILVSYAKQCQSIVSESDLFATPTGSVTSLNIQDDDPPKSKQSVHSNAFVETPV